MHTALGNHPTKVLHTVKARYSLKLDFIVCYCETYPNNTCMNLNGNVSDILEVVSQLVQAHLLKIVFFLSLNDSVLQCKLVPNFLKCGMYKNKNNIDAFLFLALRFPKEILTQMSVYFWFWVLTIEYIVLK